MRELLDFAKFLITCILTKKHKRYFVGVTNLDRYLFTLEQDTQEHKCFSGTMCPGLGTVGEVSRHLKSVKQALGSFPGNQRQIESVLATQQKGSWKEDVA